MAGTKKPSAEVDVDAGLVGRLLRSQHPDLADRPLRLLASGWDNLIFRLGEAHVVRLPRRELAAALVLHEQRWLPELAERLPLPISAPLRHGVADEGYPWPWSIGTWFEGTTAAANPPGDARRFAESLGSFLRALHRPAPHDAPENPFRGVPLAACSARFDDRVRQLGDTIDRGAVERAWEAALAAPGFEGPPLWLHGDLHPANLIVRDDALSAVIDFGDLTSGDPASDLAVAWMAFDADARPRFQAAAATAEAATWARARGWALHFAVMLLANSADEPLLHAVGAVTLERVLADPVA